MQKKNLNKSKQSHNHKIRPIKPTITNIINTIPTILKKPQSKYRSNNEKQQFHKQQSYIQVQKTRTNKLSNIREKELNKQVQKTEERQKIESNQFVRSSNNIKKSSANFRSNSLINLVSRNANTSQMPRTKNQNFINSLHARKTQTPQLILRPNSINSIQNNIKQEISIPFNTNSTNRNKSGRYEGFSLAIGQKYNKSKQYQSNSTSLFQMKAKFGSKEIQKQIIQQNQEPIAQREASRQKINRLQFSSLSLCLNPRKTVPEQIQQYLIKRQQVQILKHFEQYKKQFITKAKLLQDYIESTQDPEKVRNTYMNEEDKHFMNGLQMAMLKLYRNGTIVPNSYDNLRQEAVDQIQKWVISWIHRKIFYGKLCQDEDNQIMLVEDSLRQLQQYKNMIQNEDTSF